MQKKAFTLLSMFILIGVPAYVYLYYRMSHAAPYYICFFAFLLVAFIASVAVDHRLSRFIQPLIRFFVLTYFLIEVSMCVALSIHLVRPDLRFFFKGLSAVDQTCIRYDSVCGYKGLPGSWRYVSVENGEVEMDHLIHINANGWFSNHAYSYSKRDSRKKRYIVLGDSFSAGIAVETTWVDRASELLSAAGNDSVELYSFSQDGAGVQNWYQIFFKEIVPQYDFDGVLIAASAENQGMPDLDRNFIMADTRDGKGYMAFMDISTQAPPASFPFSAALPVLSIYTDDQISSIKSQYTSHGYHPAFSWPGLDLHFTATVCGLADGLYSFYQLSTKTTAYQKKYAAYSQLSDRPYKSAYFDQRYAKAFMIRQILDYCHTHGKSITIVAIPDCEHTLGYIAGAGNIYRNDLRYLSSEYGAGYFDGYTIFDHCDTAFVQSCFYKYDQHWNEKGVSLFADKIVRSGSL